MQFPSYDARIEKEKEIFRDCTRVHDLPEIFTYWSEKYIRPKLEAFGLSCPNYMFDWWLARHWKPSPRMQRFVSIGAGNCDLEIELAARLRQQGFSNFIIDCLDLNSKMLERGVAAAASAGFDKFINPVRADANSWRPQHEYDAVMANQALHHIVNLEELFDQIRNCLKPQGYFLVSDMVGRNGHQLWPEALEIAHEFWRQLPPSYRFNRQLQRYEELYENWDCSKESFEGIRSQDILPLLLERFHFQLFICFSNIIAPFVSRSFGHNFDINAEWDRAFIDRVHQRDEAEIASGRIKPIQMLAIVGVSPEGSMIFHPPLNPQFCVRREANSAEPRLPNPLDNPGSYDHSWPHNPQQELEIACRRLMECQAKYQKQLEQYGRLDWAIPLDRRFHGPLSGAVKSIQRMLRKARRAVGD
jgi:SAM-dependent methyltransferase